MNTVTNYLMQRVTLPILLGLGLVLAYTPAAQAHKNEFRPRVTYVYYYAYDRVYGMPRWARNDRGFHRWYMQSRYRYARRQNWHRLFDLYVVDRQYNRHHRSHYRSDRKYHGYDAPSHRYSH